MDGMEWRGEVLCFLKLTFMSVQLVNIANNLVTDFPCLGMFDKFVLNFCFSDSLII